MCIHFVDTTQGDAIIVTDVEEGGTKCGKPQYLEMERIWRWDR